MMLNRTGTFFMGLSQITVILGCFPSVFSEPYRPFIPMMVFSGLSAPLSGTAPKKIIKLSIFYGENECIEWVSIGRN